MRIVASHLRVPQWANTKDHSPAKGELGKEVGEGAGSFVSGSLEGSVKRSVGYGHVDHVVRHPFVPHSDDSVRHRA